MSENKKNFNTIQSNISSHDIILSSLTEFNKELKINSIDLKPIYDIIIEEKIYNIRQFLTINKLTRNKIRTLIGKWFPPTNEQMSIKNVVEDIYIRVFKTTEGRTNYYTGKPFSNQTNGRYEYNLIIKSKNILFIDNNRGICYIIIYNKNLRNQKGE